MTKKEITADRDVDDLYASLRGRYGGRNSRANGYLYEGYFRSEQRILFSLLDTEATVLVDVGCGSGLMVQPLISRRGQVIGVDFNMDACRAARANGLAVVRGDAFGLPFGEAVVGEIVSCQFFNQQRSVAVRQFIAESARVLRPGGQLVLVWRNGRAWVHRVVQRCMGSLDGLRGLPIFPYEDHSFEQIRSYATAVGFDVRLQAVSFPPLGWRSEAVDSWLAACIGASNICVLKKAD